MERRFEALAVAIGIATVIAVAGGSAGATPRNRTARATFDRAVKAYARGSFKQASDLFARSYRLEQDPDALFGWAQAERKQGHCDRAIGLYEKLLATNIPAESKNSIHEPLAECKAAVEPAKPDPRPEPKPELKPDPPAEPAATPAVAPAVVASADQPELVTAPPVDKPELVRVEGRPWYRDPMGDTFLGVGVVGLGVGTALWISSHGAARDAGHAGNYFEAKALHQRATDRGVQGTIAIAAGGTLTALAILWYATHREPDHMVTAWATHSSGGVAVVGRF